jgi:hypothetical protein
MIDWAIIEVVSESEVTRLKNMIKTKFIVSTKNEVRVDGASLGEVPTTKLKYVAKTN